MKVKLFRHAWGAVGPDFPWKSLVGLTRSAAQEGYDGVEFSLNDFKKESGDIGENQAQFRAMLDELNLEFMPLVSTQSEQWHDADGHLASFKSQIEQLRSWPVTKACVHAGADSFDDNTAVTFFKEAILIARDAGIEPCFETHRQRPFFNPFRTVRLIESLPDILLTADFAHWLPVLERIPYDLEEHFEIFTARAGHIHARIGHNESPQIPDPRDPVWDPFTEIHEKWWDMCVASAKARGEDIGIAPEFGPFPYTLNLPHTQTPISDLTEIVAWMTDRLRKRYCS